MKTHNTASEEKKIAVNIKLALYLVIILLLSMGSLKAQDNKYRGFEVGAGIRPITVTSNLMAIDQISVIQGGGNVGFFFGNDVFIVPIRVGFFYEAIGPEPKTFGLLELEGQVNYSLTYLLTHKKTRFNVYGIAGMNLQRSSFIGTYIDKEDRLNPSKWIDLQPVIGHQVSLNTLVGAGVEWNATLNNSYIALFAEVVGAFELGYSNQSRILSGSHIKNMTSFNIGIRLGR